MCCSLSEWADFASVLCLDAWRRFAFHELLDREGETFVRRKMCPLTAEEIDAALSFNSFEIVVMIAD